MWNFPPGFNPGAIERGFDPRDIQFRSIAGAPSVDWNRGHNVLTSLGIDLQIKDQGASGSCVGQSWAYLAEITDFVETRSHTRLSARDIYSRIYLPPDGGAYGYKGGSILKARGVAQETIVSSYPGGKVPDEAFMRIKDDSEVATRSAKVRRAAGYAHVGLTIDEIAHAIRLSNGVVLGVHGSNEGWSTGFVRPPFPGEFIWGHFLVATGYGIVNGKKCIFGPNSWSRYWGEQGFYFLSENYFNANKVFNPMALIDLPNEYVEITQMKDLIKLADREDQWIVESGSRFRIPDLDTKIYLRDKLKIILDTPRTVGSDEFNRLQDGGMIPSFPLFLKLGALFPSLKDAFENQ